MVAPLAPPENDMRIQLVSHASVIVDSGDTRIWTDPWLISKVFNDSWTMTPEPAWDTRALDTIDYVWISHEHPDHFNIPTLKALPADFKERVTVLFQQKNTEKIFAAMEQLGFRKFQSLPNRTIVRLVNGTDVYCYQVGIMDSCLAVRKGDRTIFNINDAKINARDCRIILKDLGRIDVLLNQFSLAGYNGYLDYEAHLPAYARQDLNNMLANHRDLGASVTIPFASFVYFSCSDNRHLNRFHNTPRDVAQVFGPQAVILYPGDAWTVGEAHDATAALQRFDALHADSDRLPYTEPARVPLDEIRQVFLAAAQRLHEGYPRTLLRLLQPVIVDIPDLGVVVRFSVFRRTFETVDPGQPSDLTVNSQPLHFAFRWPWGVQTLGVSARFFVRRNFRNWRLHRIVFSMNNGELYLKPSRFFTKQNLGYVVERLRSGGLNQLLGKLERMS
jgi:hypothetical protein